LFLTELKMAPSSEWMESGAGWLFLRLDKGAAYWLGKGWARELNVGDALITAPGAEGMVRASQLGEAQFHCFEFCPELAAAFLTLSERHYLEKIAVKSDQLVRVLPAGQPAAIAFANVAPNGEITNSLVQRCRMLEVAALVFVEEIAQHWPPRTNASAEQRFRDLIEQMPDSELVKHSPDELALKCGCSLRHFSRLFRKHFGTTIRTRQTELRLLKAQQLLADTDAKMMHVALESGYRHIGLFNVMFKKYLGMTPSEWREKNLKKPRKEFSHS
jgi:AraC-like DNA-binding protein